MVEGEIIFAVLVQAELLRLWERGGESGFARLRTAGTGLN